MSKQTKKPVNPIDSASQKKLEACLSAYQLVAKSHRDFQSKLIALLVDMVQKRNGNTEYVRRLLVEMVKRYPVSKYASTGKVLTWFGLHGFSIKEQDGKIVSVSYAKGSGPKDSKWLAECKANPWYSVTPEQEVQLKAPKLSFEGVATVAARGLLTGTIAQEDIESAIGSLQSLIADKLNNEKVIDWVTKYNEQHPDEKAA